MIAILPVGKVNVKTGKFKYGEFYGFWGNDTTYEVYKCFDDKIKVIATSGTSPINKSLVQAKFFRHDQTGRQLFGAVMLEYVIGDEGFKSLASKYGNSLSTFTYK